MTKLKTSPPRPQPKHFQLSRAGVTTKLGVFSPWNGQRPLNVVPGLLERDRLPDHVGDLESTLHFSCDTDGRAAPPHVIVRRS